MTYLHQYSGIYFHQNLARFHFIDWKHGAILADHWIVTILSLQPTSDSDDYLIDSKNVKYSVTLHDAVVLRWLAGPTSDRDNFLGNGVAPIKERAVIHSSKWSSWKVQFTCITASHFLPDFARVRNCPGWATVRITCLLRLLWKTWSHQSYRTAVEWQCSFYTVYFVFVVSIVFSGTDEWK